MPRRGENIRKRSDGRWESRLFIKETGKYKYFYAKTYTEAKHKRNEYISKADINVQKKEPYSHIIMSEVFRSWLSDRMLSVRQSTLANYENIIRLHLQPMFGNMKLYEMTIQSVNGTLLEWMANGGKDLSSKYTHDIITVLRAVLCFCASGYGLPINTSEILSVPLEKKDTAVLSEYEQRKLIRYLSGSNEPAKLGIILCLYTGMRLGEVCALKWNDIHIKDGYIDISKTIYRSKKVNNIYSDDIPKTEVIIGKPKTDSSVRKIPLCDFIAEKLLSAGGCDNENYFLTGSSDYFEPRTYQLAFRRYLKEAGIKHFKFHALRHTFATNCIDSGCDIKSLSEMLGHSSVKITLDRYVHPSMKTKKNQLEKLSVF